MAWRVIHISNPAHLSTKDNQLAIKQESLVSIPIEDIDSLVLDGNGIVMTANLLTQLSGLGVTVVICDEKHMPTSVLLPYSQHSRQARASRRQLAMSRPLQKQLWQQIIVRKILNQASVLRKYNYAHQALVSLASDVRSGDVSNRESQAARLYFAVLLDDATRRKPIWHNAALNYGYAMVRSHIARHVAARGLIASQGIFHRNELNGFNLVDDIIEPFRPAVDDYVLSHVAPFHTGGSDAGLSLGDRQQLVDVLNYSVMIKNKKVSVRYAVECTVESFVQSIENNEGSALALPSIVS